MKHMYAVSFNPFVINSVEFHNAILSLDILTWWHYLPSTYLISTTATVVNIQDQLCEKFPDQFFLVIKVDPHDFGGFLPSDAWEWIRKNR